jgi:hypothetical protein
LAAISRALTFYFPKYVGQREHVGVERCFGQATAIPSATATLAFVASGGGAACRFCTSKPDFARGFHFGELALMLGGLGLLALLVARVDVGRQSLLAIKDQFAEVTRPWRPEPRHIVGGCGQPVERVAGMVLVGLRHLLLPRGAVEQAWLER